MSTKTETSRTAPTTAEVEPLDVEALKTQFPALHQTVHGKPLVYLDSAASSQKPQRVIDAISHYYEAVSLKPDYAKAHKNLGIALTKAGRIDDAVEQFQIAIRLQPDFLEAHDGLRAALNLQSNPNLRGQPAPKP